MSLQVWLPLNKNIIENKGLSDVVFTNSNPSGITFVDSGIESCYNFSATSGNGIIGTFLDFAIKHSFSICAWFKTTSTSTYTPIVCMTTGIRLFVGGLNRLQLSNGTNTVSCNANITTNDGKWHHTIGTYDISDNKLRIYIDGQLKNTVDYNQEELYDNPWHDATTVGKDLNGREADYRWFDGSASDIRIYDHALSDKEVYELAKGLMFHLKLDNTDLYDCSGYGWSVSKYSSGTLTENADTARYGKSLKFDNTGITMPLMIANDTKKFSIACWLCPSGSAWRNIFSNRSGHPADGDLRGFDMYVISGTNKIRFWNADSGLNSNDAIQNNTWNHIVCTFDEGVAKCIYINGVLSISSTYTGVIRRIADNFNTSAIGMRHDASSVGDYYSGFISDFRIYRTALTDEQVAELYKVGGSIDNHGNAHCYELVEN